jgi:hypothetical protein
VQPFAEAGLRQISATHSAPVAILQPGLFRAQEETNMTEDTTTPQVEEETEAGWAFRYGQEARIRAELETRYAACIYDIGIVIDQFQRLLKSLADNDDSWIEKLPNYVDQLFDLSCLVQQFMVTPIGDAKETEFADLAEKVKTDQDVGEDLDEIVEQFLSTRNKQNLKNFNKFLKNEPPLYMSYKDRRTGNRQAQTGELLSLFIKLMELKGIPIPSEIMTRLVEKHTLQ